MGGGLLHFRRRGMNWDPTSVVIAAEGNIAFACVSGYQSNFHGASGIGNLEVVAETAAGIGPRRHFFAWFDSTSGTWSRATEIRPV